MNIQSKLCLDLLLFLLILPPPFFVSPPELLLSNFCLHWRTFLILCYLWLWLPPRTLTSEGLPFFVHNKQLASREISVRVEFSIHKAQSSIPGRGRTVKHGGPCVIPAVRRKKLKDQGFKAIILYHIHTYIYPELKQRTPSTVLHCNTNCSY